MMRRRRHTWSALDGQPFQGIVATRTSVAEGFSDPSTPIYYCFATFARDYISSLRAVWSHWYGNGVSPGAGKNMTITAEVEYPNGVYTPITFGGKSTVTVLPLTNVTCDPVAVSIPNGAIFRIRGLYTGCCNQTRGPNATIGEGSVFPATGLNLVTARSATFNANFTYTPSVVIGATTKRSVMIIGDSHPSGLGDSYTRADGSYGTVGGALNVYPWAQMVQWGGSPADYLAGAGPLQAELVQYATDVVVELGGNHLFDGDTAAFTLAQQAAIKALYPTKTFHLTTISPKTTSTDNWATLANQTVIANESELQAYNIAVLANAMGYSTPINLATVMESTPGSGKWKVDGTANKYTVEGVHPSQFCYALFPGAGFTL